MQRKPEYMVTFAKCTLLCICIARAAVGRAEELHVNQWTPHVLRFDASADHNWRAFPMQTVFTHKTSSDTLTLDAYWDGGRTWCVRFAPTMPGVWMYRTKSGDPGLDGKTGQIACVAPSKDDVESNPNLRGQVRVVPGGRYFTYADGTPFLGLAEQFWDFNVSSWMPLDDVDKYLADRKAKGFNIAQIRYTRVNMPNEGGYAFPNNSRDSRLGNGDFSRLNEKHFAALDQRLEKCFDAGFVVAGHPMWIGYDVKISVEDAKLLQRYLLARYGAYNIIWSLAGEFDKAFNAERGGKVKWRDAPQVKGVWNNGGRFDPDTDCEPWRELGRDAAKHNPYGVPISVHPNVGMGDRRSSGDWMHGETWLDHNWIQTYKAVHLVPGRVQRDYQREPIKPVFFSEGIREGDQTEDIGVGAYGVRWEAWQAFLSGATIHTYRHFGVYMERWHAQGRCGPLLENLDATGSVHAGIAAEFLRAQGPPHRSWCNTRIKGHGALGDLIMAEPGPEVFLNYDGFKAGDSAKAYQSPKIQAMGVDQEKPSSEELARTAFQRNDRNRDGVLSRQEIPAAQRGHFDAADADNDGSLTLEELTNALERRRDR